MNIFSCSCVHLSCRFNPAHTSQITPVQNMFAFYLFNITPTHLKQKTQMLMNVLEKKAAKVITGFSASVL